MRNSKNTVSGHTGCYVSPLALVSEACRLENRLCALSLIQTPGASFNPVKFTDKSDDSQWEESWTE